MENIPSKKILTALLLGATLYIIFFVMPSGENISTEVVTHIPGASQMSIGAGDIEMVADGLDTVWEIAFLPAGDVLATERGGNLVRITGMGREKHIFSIPGVYQHPKGENGLMGMALHPDFSNNHWVYLYYTARSNELIFSRIARYTLTESGLNDRILIFESRAGRMHYGGRMAFGPDNFLYFTSGDAGDKKLAQDTASLAGKILRVKDNGDIPEDNPFNNAIFSYGHRNPQGIAWDNEERFWATEHGEAGIIGKSEQKSGLDEINLIKIAGNYGWPDIRGVDKKYNITPPIAIPASGITWAPAGLAYYNGYLFFGGLRGKALYQAKISPDGKMGSFYAHFENEFGRVRAVKTGPDGYIYFSTSNRDQKGAESAPSDKIFRIRAEALIQKYP